VEPSVLHDPWVLAGVPEDVPEQHLVRSVVSDAYPPGIGLLPAHASAVIGRVSNSGTRAMGFLPVNCSTEEEVGARNRSSRGLKTLPTLSPNLSKAATTA
jgi:hypothetical protein